MLAENINETNKPKAFVDFEYVDFDHYDTVPYKKEDLANTKAESAAAAIIVTAPSPIKMPEILDSNYQPENEQALIDYVMSQNNKLEIANIFVKWEIGRSINSFYKGKYGAHELDKIAQATGIGKDNLNKMIKFAEQYTQEQLKALIKGSFTISWNGIAQNLAIKPEKLVEVYEKAGSINEFNRELIKLKDPGETRGKPKQPKNAEATAMDVDQPEQSNAAPAEITVALTPEIEDVKIMATADVIEAKACDENPPMPAERDDAHYVKELGALKAENEKLKKEIANKNEQINSMNAMMKEDSRDIDDKARILAAYRDRFKRLRYMIENSYGVGAIMELLVNVE